MRVLVAMMSPPEAWVWIWLSCLYLSNLSQVMRLCKGDFPPRFSRKQFLRIIRSLEQKKFLTLLRIPKNQTQTLDLVFRPALCLDIFDRAPGHECLGGPVLEAPWRSAGEFLSRQKLGGNTDKTLVSISAGTFLSGQPASASASALESKSLKALVGEHDQAVLLSKVHNLGADELEIIWVNLFQIVFHPRKRGISKKAAIFAGIRFLQSGRHWARNPEAWIERVAAFADKRYKAILSGEGLPEREFRRKERGL